ncbi:MAG TPA: hypothetical protein VKI44_43310 [Acetobacteraceae bacterium]|nr:hypothetical protein [Acetobacteraceae bacterium]
MPPPPPPPVPLFPPAPTINLVGNSQLQNALKAAVTAVTVAGKPPPFGLTIVDLTSASASGNDFASAGLNQDVEHYAASMLKVACLYAAHALRDLVQRFARTRGPKDSATLFQILQTELSPQIAVCCPTVAGRAPKVLLPRWQDVFTASGTGAGMSVRFTSGYTASLEQMIVPSDNAEAGRCIRGVGYAYLNGLMLKHGVFDSGNNTGVWLAGDFSGSDVVTIPCDNDKDTKQGTTSAMMARLGTVILVGSVLPAASHGEMIELLKKSSHGSDSSYFTRSQIPTHLNGTQVTHGKIGLGPLKSGRDVYSDLNAIADPLGHGGRFIVCYTNVDYNPYAIDHVLWVFRETVRVYQSAASTAAAAPASTAAPRATATP